MKIALYISLVLAIIIIIAFFFMGRSSAKGSALGLVNGQLAPLSSKPNAVSSEINTRESRRVEPFFNTSLPAVKAAIEATGGHVTFETDQYLSAIYVSKMFKFVDDVEVRMDGTTAHIRSASRVGYSDRDVNEYRVDAISKLLE